MQKTLQVFLAVAVTVVGCAAPVALAPSSTAAPASVQAAVPAPRAAGDCGSCVVDVAIYDPANEDDGVWEEEVKALESFASTFGWTTRKVDAAALSSGELGVGATRRYRMLAAPGGWAAVRMAEVTPTGDEAIRQFVSSGGGYVGLCAGAYWAAHTVSFATVATGGRGTFNTAADYREYPYDVGLFNGSAVGPFGWTPWAGGTQLNFEPARINTSNSAMAAAKMPAKTRFVYGGGPVFRPSGAMTDYQVWATAIAPPGTRPRAATGRGEPTVVRFSYGAGPVVLFSYHPDVLIHSKKDGVTLHQYYNENRIHWKRGGQSFSQINKDSWNIVHAAFQVSMSQPVTPAPNF